METYLNPWITIFASFMIHVFHGGVMKSFTMFYPSWRALYNVSNAEVSIVYSALAGSMQIGGFLSRYTGNTQIQIDQ